MLRAEHVGGQNWKLLLLLRRRRASASSAGGSPGFRRSGGVRLCDHVPLVQALHDAHRRRRENVAAVRVVQEVWLELLSCAANAAEECAGGEEAGDTCTGTEMRGLHRTHRGHRADGKEVRRMLVMAVLH